MHEHQHYQQHDEMRVSAIPLTPVRTREKIYSNGTSISNGSVPRSVKSVPRFEDIMNERPDPSAVDHLSLPEDHLEDILAYAALHYTATKTLAYLIVYPLQPAHRRGTPFQAFQSQYSVWIRSNY